jgi:exosortase/archaeosortase
MPMACQGVMAKAIKSIFLSFKMEKNVFELHRTVKTFYVSLNFITVPNIIRIVYVSIKFFSDYSASFIFGMNHVEFMF